VVRSARCLEVALFVLAVTSAASCRRAKPAAGSIEGTLSVGGRERTYLLHVPEGAEDGVALVVALHGRGGDGVSQEQLTGMSALADREGFAVVYPDGVSASWNDGRPGTPAAEAGVDDVAFIDALIDHLTTSAGVDAERVYVTGMSNGAMMAQRLGCDLGDRIAAIGPVAGLLPEAVADDCPAGRAMPAMMFFGDEDPLMPYEGGELPAGAGGEVRSAQGSFAFWAERAGCTGEAEVRALPDAEDDGTVVTEHRHRACEGGAEVTLHAIAGGGHTWPGGWQYAARAFIGPTSRDVDATRLLWAFFRDRRLP
jgi:polyhydroxybutyrate depolymerase